ncbi:hypothetical protein Angca_004173 [Angiostrongylus cantonensis]|nr:hypothetical protein Angca_004173 [Angiostrongylus cantonensis]
MSLNRSMHPRNPYKESPPDFNDLATRFPDFRAHCTLGNNGRVIVRVLEVASSLLIEPDLPQEYFSRVSHTHSAMLFHTPDNHCYQQPASCMKEHRRVMLILGTGASCIYALLGARWAGWKFFATETNTRAAEAANANVVRNQLGHLIHVIHISEQSTTLIKDLSRRFMDLQFTFCMCNPPFFESCETIKRFSFDKASGAMINDSPTDLDVRTPPRSATLAQRGELEVDGGEVAFIGKLIDESVLLQTQVSIYTTMLGKKSSISVLCRRLSRIDGVRYTVSTLSQGRTLRWVLAWTFLPQIHLENKSFSTLFLPFPDSMKTSPLQWIRSHLEHLGIETEHENFNMLICSARNVTWTNQRAKRRADAKLNAPAMKKMKFSNSDVGIQVLMGVGDGRDSLSNSGNFESCISIPNSCGRSDVHTQAYFPCSVRPSLLRFRVIHFRENCGISFEYIDGYKPGLHQLLQFLKNQIK